MKLYRRCLNAGGFFAAFGGVAQTKTLSPKLQRSWIGYLGPGTWDTNGLFEFKDTPAPDSLSDFNESNKDAGLTHS